MHMGHYAAINVHQHMLAECTGGKTNFLTLQPFPPMMALAVGNKAVTYSPTDGTRDGEDLMTSMFGDDMGNTRESTFGASCSPCVMADCFPVCWNYMRLGEPCPV